MDPLIAEPQPTPDRPGTAPPFPARGGPRPVDRFRIDR